MENKTELKNTKIDEEKSFTILDIILVFLKNKKKIFLLTGFACLISIILYFFIFDLIYFSYGSIKSTSKSGGLLSSIEGLPDIGGLDDLGLGGSKSAKDMAAYENILVSRRCIEPLIVKFKLMERDNYRFMEDAIYDFATSKMKLEEDKLAGILKIGVYDKDPQLAKDMVEFLLEQLDKINIELNILQARNNREFIEQRYYQARKDLTNAEDSLKSFQFIYGVSPDLQIKASAQSMFSLETQLKTEEVKLDVLKKILSEEQPEVKTQEATVFSLKNKVNEIKNSTDINEILSLGNSPSIAISYLRLQREVELQTKILTFLLPVYEQAKIEERKETPTIIILDKPYIAEKKSKPKRLTMVIAITCVSFLFFNVVLLIHDRYIYWKKLLKSEMNNIDEKKLV